jgi:hypothetical protein
VTVSRSPEIINARFFAGSIGAKALLDELA